MWNAYNHEKNYSKVIDVADKYSPYICDRKNLTKLLFMKGVSLRKTCKPKEEKKI